MVENMIHFGLSFHEDDPCLPRFFSHANAERNPLSELLHEGFC